MQLLQIRKKEDKAHEDSDIPHLNLAYFEIPMTMELKRRQQEESIRHKYGIPKNKSGVLL